MPDDTEPIATLAWCRPDQVALVRAVAGRARLEFTLAGAPEPGRAGQVGAELGAPPADDLRAALASTDASLALIADPGSFGAGGNDEDAGAIAAARARGTRIVALEPIPPAAADASGSAWVSQHAGGRPIDAIRLGALPRRSPAWRAAEDALEAFGPVRAMTLEVLAPEAAGSLGATAVGAADLLLAVMGEPESVDASIVGGARPLTGESLRGLEGTLGALARAPDGRTATILVSDRAGAWSCAATLLGEGGSIRVSERGFVWVSPEGGVLDEHAVPGAGEPAEAAAAVITDRVTRLLDGGAPEQAPDGVPDAMAVAQAALLSARTGQPESPATIKRLVAR